MRCIRKVSSFILQKLVTERPAHDVLANVYPTWTLLMKFSITGIFYPLVEFFLPCSFDRLVALNLVIGNSQEASGAELSEQGGYAKSGQF
jgi:hypothetical protein